MLPVDLDISRKDGAGAAMQPTQLRLGSRQLEPVTEHSSWHAVARLARKA
jgi:hypothetical protein